MKIKSVGGLVVALTLSLVLSPAYAAKEINNELEAVRFLSMATFGAKQSDVNQLVGSDAATWMQAEFDKPPTIFLADVNAIPNGGGAFDNVSGAQYWDKIVTADDQLRQRMVFALSQILVTSNTNMANWSHRNLHGYYKEILTLNAFGNYRDLLDEVTYSPVMGRYLTYLGNRKGDPSTGREPDENYAREILQLFSIGLIELNRDGTPKLDANGQEIQTYDNDDIVNLARVFTGLSYDASKFFPSQSERSLAFSKPMKMFENEHSPLRKQFMATDIPPNTSGTESVRIALDAIFNHPNVGPFIGRQLIQRFTDSDPDPAYVSRVAKAFDTGRYRVAKGQIIGTGNRGDMKATIAAVLLDDAVLNVSTRRSSDTAGKVREPVLLFTNWARAFNASNINSEKVRTIRDAGEVGKGLSQYPFRAGSVFNFYEPGYVAPQTASGALDKTVPEFQIMNEGSAVGYTNYMTRFATETTNQVGTNYVPDYSLELSLAYDSAALIDHLDLLLTAQQLSDSTKQDITNVLDAMAKRNGGNNEKTDRRKRVEVAIIMVMHAPAYAVIR